MPNGPAGNGLTDAALEDYIKAVRKADLAEKGDDDVFRKVKAGPRRQGREVADADIRKKMGEFLAKAVQRLESGKT